ncbi:MAG TPA: hypothetical protein VGD36_08710 [Xanthobacteraceae bacterium]|jgi:hypothetical protein
MTKGQLLARYKDLSAEDQRTFNRWLTANAVIGSLFALAVAAMAFNASPVPGPGPATATASTSERTVPRPTAQYDEPRHLSPYEMMLRRHPDQLPVHPYAEPF